MAYNFPKKRSYGAAFGGRRPRRGFGKKPRYGRKTPMYKTPYVPSQLVACHTLGQIPIPAAGSPGAGFLGGVIGVDHLLTSETFKKQAALHERFCIKSISAKFVVAGQNTGCNMALSMLSKDDHDAITGVEAFLRSPSLMNHVLSDDKSCSRTMSLSEIPMLSKEKMVCTQAATLLGGANYRSSIKLLVPQATTGTIQVYITFKVVFYGEQSLSETKIGQLTAGF